MTEDQLIFQQAKGFFDQSLSSLIVEYVRELVKRRVEMTDQYIEVGEWPCTGYLLSNQNKTKKFVGKVLYSKSAPAYQSDYIGVNWTIYSTQKGKILIHYVVTAQDRDNSKAANFKVFDQLSVDEEYKVGWEDFNVQPGYYLPKKEIKSIFHELTVPCNFVYEALKILGENPVEELDV